MLEIARKIEMYGITLYPAQDSDGVKLNLAVYHSGILVFQDRNRVINNFSWLVQLFLNKVKIFHR